MIVGIRQIIFEFKYLSFQVWHGRGSFFRDFFFGTGQQYCMFFFCLAKLHGMIVFFVIDYLKMIVFQGFHGVLCRQQLFLQFFDTLFILGMYLFHGFTQIIH